EARCGELNRAWIDVDAEQVILDDRLGDLVIADRRPAVLRFFSIQRDEEIEGDYQEVATSACWIEKLHFSNRFRRIRDRVVRDWLRDEILPPVFESLLDWHQGVERDLSDFSLLSPFSASCIESWEHRFSVR